MRRIMRKGLAVKADHLGTREAGENFGMGSLNHFGGGGHVWITRPLAEGFADDGLFGGGVGAGLVQGAEIRQRIRRARTG